MSDPYNKSGYATRPAPGTMAISDRGALAQSLGRYGLRLVLETIADIWHHKLESEARPAHVPFQDIAPAPHADDYLLAPDYLGRILHLAPFNGTAVRPDDYGDHD